MKKTIFISVIIFSCFGLFSQNWVNINSATAVPVETKLISSNIENSIIQFYVDGFTTTEVQTPNGTELIISLDETSPLLITGAPDLPKATASVIIPDLAKMEIKVISSSFQDFNNIEIAPSKGNFTRDIDPKTVAYTYGKQYSENKFFPEKITSLRNPYIVRDYRGQTIIVNPFQYNPVSKVLRVYTEITVEVGKVSNNGVNPLIRTKELTSINEEFGEIYSQHFLNLNSNKYTPVDDHGNMLIICYADFISAMQPFIDWKTKIGLPVELVDVASIGNSSAIKTYIQNYYNANGLTFALLVGDAAQVPSSYASGDSDNDYSYVVGNDHYPDLFVGRFSAENVSQVETQVERSVEYEENPYHDIDWFTIGTGIASSQGTGDDGEYDYEHIRNINTDLLNFTYTYCNELFDGSQGGNDASGNPSPTMVAQALNDGSTIINYCGHGSTNSWGSSNFSSSNVNTLTNNGMLPFIWSVACVNGNFVGGSCFAEAWLRAENNGEPAGAVATLMSTINQSWNPPMDGQDEMNDILVESYTDNIKRSFSGISMNGCMHMNDEYGSSGDEITDTWVCFGDPSLMVRTAVPQEMTVSYYPTIFIGMDELTVTCNAEDGFVCLTLDGEIIATAFVESGSATLQFEELTAPDIIDIAITGFNYLPHIGIIEIVPANTPYLLYESHIVVDTAGNNNGSVNGGEDIYLTMEIINLGGEPGNNAEATIRINDEYITITDSTENYGNIPANSTVTKENAFAFTVGKFIPDLHILDFEVLVTDENDSTWESNCQIIATAPILSIEGFTVNDVSGGDGNGRLDPGETVFLEVSNSNDGHAVAENCISSISTLSPYIQIINSIDSIGYLGFFGSKLAIFEIVVDPDIPSGVFVADFVYEIVSGDYSANKTFSERLGLVFEDFETGNFSKFEWEQAGNADWTITTAYPYEGYYSAKSGTITHNQTTELKITLEIMTADSISFIRKVSSDPGDKLKFYIGNTLMDEWSGTTDGWKKESYFVSTGWKSFRWVYQKNNSKSFGSDCAWLDFMVFPPLMTLTAYAGPDDLDCNLNDYQCSGSATDYVSLAWTTSGTGTFNDNTILDPIYTPSFEDFSAGIITLTLEATNTEGETYDDEMELSFSETPDSPEKPTGPVYIDVEATPTSQYTTTQVEYASSYEWQIFPEEAGTISGSGTASTATWSNDYTGLAYISVSGINDCGNGDYSSELEVTVDNAVEIIENSSSLINIFPNPNTGIFNFTLNNFSDEADVKILNNLGAQVYYKSAVSFSDEENCSVNISKLPQGIYYLFVSNNSTLIYKKFIILK